MSHRDVPSWCRCWGFDRYLPHWVGSWTCTQQGWGLVGGGSPGHPVRGSNWFGKAPGSHQGYVHQAAAYSQQKPHISKEAGCGPPGNVTPGPKHIESWGSGGQAAWGWLMQFSFQAQWCTQPHLGILGIQPWLFQLSIMAVTLLGNKLGTQGFASTHETLLALADTRRWRHSFWGPALPNGMCGHDGV